MVDVRLKISIVTSTSYKQLQAVTNNQYPSFDSNGYDNFNTSVIDWRLLGIDLNSSRDNPRFAWWWTLNRDWMFYRGKGRGWISNRGNDIKGGNKGKASSKKIIMKIIW